MTVAMVVLTAVAVVLAGELWRRSTRGLLVRRTRRRVVLTTLTGDTFDGLLLDADRDVVVMVKASLVPVDGDQVPVDGELILLRDQVAYLQRP